MLKHINEYKAVYVIKEIVIDGFEGNNPPVLRVMSDKQSYLVFGTFPPQNRKVTKQQANNFAKLLANATKKKVIHDDRELFVIFDDSDEMIDKVVSFLQSFSE